MVSPNYFTRFVTLADKVAQHRVYPKIDFCFLGTAPVSLKEKQKFAQIFKVQPLENYGLSETTFISSESIKNISFRTESSIGQVMPDVEVKLIPVDDGKAVTEIWVKTPYLMLGYLGTDNIIKPL